MMDLETTCHVSHVTCHMSHVTCHMSLFNFSQTVRARDLQFAHDIHHTLCVMCLVSHVRCHMSLESVTCNMSCVPCHNIFLFVLQSLEISW